MPTMLNPTSHTIEFATKQVGALALMSWTCACGDRGDWRAADVSRNEADNHVKRSSALSACELIAEGAENVHRDAMTDEQFRRFAILKRDLIHAALSRATARREVTRLLALLVDTTERLDVLVADGDVRLAAETEREKLERDLSLDRGHVEENEAARKLDAAAEALLVELERGR